MDTNRQVEKLCTLTELPNEILSSICSYLPKSTCYHVALVSRRLKEVVEPQLYHTISQEHLNVDSLNTLLSTLKARPTLCAHVSNLRMGTGSLIPEYRNSERQEELLTLVPGLRELELIPPMNNLQVQDSIHLRALKLDYTAAYICYCKQNIPQQSQIDPLEIMAKPFLDAIIT